jgi:hypothetical protein
LRDRRGYDATDRANTRPRAAEELAMLCRETDLAGATELGVVAGSR